MPASEEEVEAALEEGVRIDVLVAPEAMDADGLTCVRMLLSDADSGGRPRPLPVPGSGFRIAADLVIVAIGQQVEIPARGLSVTGGGTIAADPLSLATSIPGLFAGGDAVTGPASVIDAIAQGRRASSAIDRYLGGAGDLEAFAGVKPAARLEDCAPRGSRRHGFDAIPLADRLGGFQLVEKAYDPATAMREAGRCLSCDLRSFAVRVNPAACKDCGYCKDVCGLDVFERSEDFNTGGYRPYLAARPHHCIGCLQCLYICPDFAITIV